MSSYWDRTHWPLQCLYFLLPMLAAGLEQLLAWGVPEIQATCARLGNASVEGACDLGYGAEAAAYRHDEPPACCSISLKRSTCSCARW